MKYVYTRQLKLDVRKLYKDCIGFDDKIYDVRWAWHTNDGAKRLYFASEKELNWFVLTWSS